ncbi:MAG TPA: SUMF1/EgtB/PvdO family nonheme iron enzyme [Vicinamibacteria bacterium]
MKRALASLATLLAVASLFPSHSSRGGSAAPLLDASHPGMVLVPAGRFVMGLNPEEAEAAQRAYGGDPAFYRACVPRRSLDLPAFWIDRTEVTQRMYAAFVRATGHAAPDDEHLWAAPYRWRGGAPPPGLEDHPVTLVTFDDAQAYCRWRGLQLPTEEQWEKAARGGDGRAYPWGNRYLASRLAGAEQRSPIRLARIETWTDWWRTVYRGQMRGREVGTFPVGSFPLGASPYGALDMAGNVFEWVDAFYDAYPGAAEAHPDFGQGYRVVRGGDWYLDRIYHHTAMRLRAPADHRVPTIGFRCACSRIGDGHAAPE